MKKQDLNGSWLYRIGHGSFSEITVPFSRLPVGHSECVREFDCDIRPERVFLKFEGITYHAKVLLNENEVGEMLPYCEYKFDVTSIIKATGNRLEVHLEDISPKFGPSEGWENYGGIIRNVSLEYCNDVYIKDVFFHSEPEHNYSIAKFTAEIESEALPSDEIELVLSYKEEIVFKTNVNAKSKDICGSLENVHLWSPEEPNLYSLCVNLKRDAKILDSYSQNVGFREFKCDKHRFLLNGKPIFLLGVCKHEMIGNSGHSPTVMQIEEDLRAIKESGCNFVRLVHYPHAKETIDIADRIGLMISEEPGLWWSDTADPDVSAGSLEVLRRTILRDRNHPSIMFWLCFNECRFTEKFLIDSARVCRENDPTRLVSGANCMNNEDTLKYYNLCNFDFYTMHPYSQTFDRAAESAKILNDKPLLFTEWGGHYVYNNHKLLSEFIHKLYALYKSNSDEGAIAGAFFWFWAEVNDFNRSSHACRDGVLTEALFTSDRQPNPIFDTFKNAWADAKSSKNSPRSLAYFEAVGDSADLEDKTPFICQNKETGFARLCEDILLRIPEPLSRMRYRKPLGVGPQITGAKLKGLNETPFTLFDSGELIYKGFAEGDTVTLIGAVSAKKGYPIAGKYGEGAALVTVICDDGSEESFKLRNGIEFTTIFTTLSSSRIDPYAEKATRFALFGYDRNFENYVLNRLDLKLSGNKKITEIRLRSLDKGYDLPVYGILV